MTTARYNIELYCFCLLRVLYYPITMEHFFMTKIQKIVSITLTILIVSTLGLYQYGVHRTEQEILSGLEKLEQKGLKFQYKKLDIGLASFTMRNAKLTSTQGKFADMPPIAIQTITAQQSFSLEMLWNKNYVGNERFTIEHLEFMLSPKQKKEWGSASIVVNASGNSTYSKPQYDSKINITVEDACTMNAAFSTYLPENVLNHFIEVATNPDYTVDKAEEQALFKEIGIREITVSLQDVGLFKKLENAGLPPAIIKMQTAQLASIPQLNYQADIDAFLSGAKSLEASFKVDTPKGINSEKIMTMLFMPTPDVPKVVIRTK